MSISELPGVFPFSGLENHLLTLLPALKRGGVDVEFIVMTWNVGPEMTKRLSELESQGVSVTLVPCSRNRQWRWLKVRRLEQAARLRPLLAERRERIIHFHVDLGLVGLVLFAQRYPRIIMSIHNDDPWLFDFPWRLWLRWIDRGIAHYIAISERVRRHYLAASGIAPHKVTRVYYGLEPAPINSGVQEIRQKHHIPNDRFVVGFVGRLTQQKNVSLLIAALKQLPEVHGVIVGDGELRKDLEASAASGGAQNIQFLGYQPDAAQIMPGFDALCLPSKFEGLGLVLIEAMLHRVGIIGSRAGAIPEILGQGEYGLLFDSGDVHGLVTAIQYAQREQARMAAMVEHAFDYAQRAFTVDAMAAQTIQVYEMMC